MTIVDAFIRFDEQLAAEGRTLKTRKNYRCALKSLVEAWGDIEVQLISLDHITSFKRESLTQGDSIPYIKTNLCKLREVLRDLRERGFKVLDSRDIKLPREENRVEKPWLLAEDVQRILDTITSPRDRALFYGLFSTGSRIGAFLDLNRDSIDFTTGEAQVIGKGGKVNYLHFDSNSLRLVRDYLSGRKDDMTPLFISGHYRRLTVARAEQLLHIYSDRAGIDKNVTPHTLRRSFASDLKKNGADLYDVMKLLNHSQISTTQKHYTFTTKEYTRDKYEQFHTRLR